MDISLDKKLVTIYPSYKIIDIKIKRHGNNRLRVFYRYGKYEKKPVRLAYFFNDP